MPKLLLLDVDGVMTDGTKIYGPDGKVFGKRFCDHDFTAIKKFQADGWAVVWLSADKTVNEAVAADRNIRFCYSRLPDGTIDKVHWYKFLVEDYNVNPKDVVYVGDDLLDLPVMKAVVDGGGRAFYPANAVPQFRWMMHNNDYLATKLSGNGGEGAVMSLYYLYYPENSTPPTH